MLQQIIKILPVCNQRNGDGNATIYFDDFPAMFDNGGHWGARACPAATSPS